MTDIPDNVVQYARGRLVEGTYVDDEFEPDGVTWKGSDLDRPRKLRVSISRLKAEYPALAAKIDKLFDPTFTLAEDQIPEVTWAKIKKAFWHKIHNRVVTDAEVEE